MNLALAAARRVRRTAIRSLRLLGDTCGAQAHTDSGTSTITKPMQTLGYPVLKSYAVAGDFEGGFTVALGLHGTTSIRSENYPGTSTSTSEPEHAQPVSGSELPRP
jgi:hypothetical protein